MKTYLHSGALLIMICAFAPPLLSQDNFSEEEAFKKHLSAGLYISHAHVFQGLDAGGHHQVLSLSSWSVDFNYALHPKWGIGLHTDIISEKYKVEGPEEETIEVSFPVAPALMGIYKPGQHFEFLLGAGVELTSEEQVFLTRMGLGYTIEINPGWEMSGALTYDLKYDSYDTWVFGLGVIRVFGQGKPKE